MSSMTNAYARADVDAEAGYEVVERVRKHVKKTEHLGMMGAIGGFGGRFDLSVFQLKEPVLVSGTGSVGTKLAVAIEANKYDTIGIDCIAICVNDILARGAEPSYFLDYLAAGENDPLRLGNVVKGIADGYVQGNMVLVGGETAEMPGVYSGNGYNLAGFVIGVVGKSRLLTGETISPRDVLLGIASSGIHSNGHSLIRKIFFEQQQFSLSSRLPELKKALDEELLEPTKIYVSSLLPLIKEKKIKGATYITGGGFAENVPRILPESMAAQIKLGSWPILPIFDCLQKYDEIPEMEMYKIFNMDIGVVLAVEGSKIKEITHEIEQADEKVYEIGKVIAKEKHRVAFIGEGR